MPKRQFTSLHRVFNPVSATLKLINMVEQEELQMSNLEDAIRQLRRSMDNETPEEFAPVVFKRRCKEELSGR
jgi:hypothetical protein